LFEKVLFPIKLLLLHPLFSFPGREDSLLNLGLDVRVLLVGSNSRLAINKFALKSVV
jgi:hypothetical protein